LLVGNFAASNGAFLSCAIRQASFQKKSFCESKIKWTMKNWLLFVIAGLAVAAGCSETPSIPKPRGYPKVVYPEKKYRPFDESYCSFTFSMPTYARIEQDTLFFEEKPQHPCWFNIYVPDFDCAVHCSYYPVAGAKELEELKKDAFELAAKHNIRADFIDELPIERPDGTSGFAFDIQGPAASPFQFFLTDGKKHFLRGALYFNTQINTDSLAPVYDFMKTDIIELINTLEWQGG
jgi:gliding motility-associated lipoprotein GldD